MKQALFLLLTLSMLQACKGRKKNETPSNFFPVLSYLQAQAKDVDTSLYRILVVDTRDTVVTRNYIRLEEFRTYARDFLQLPDITSEDLRDDYTETKYFDEALNTVILTYTTEEKDNEVVRQDVMVSPELSESGVTDVKNIIVNTNRDKGDSTVQKTMVWYVGKRFTVVTKVQRPNQPEKVWKREVVWNDFNDQ
jgi:hypothetical protein